MAAYTNFNRSSAVNHLRHISRQIQNPSNEDIDQERIKDNYRLSPERDIEPFEYLKQRLSEVKVFNKKDLNVMGGWIITMPKSLPESQEKIFFEECYNFLKNRYGGERNVISCEVHKDEAGQPHMHYYFIPTIQCEPNYNQAKVMLYLKEHPRETNVTKIANALGLSRRTVRRYRYTTEADLYAEKVCASDVVNRYDLKKFHGDLQRHLKRKGIDANVNSGITREQGGNKTVEELKNLSKQKLIEKIQELEKEMAKDMEL